MRYVLTAVGSLLMLYFWLWLVLTKPWRTPVEQALNKRAEANQAFQEVFIELFEERFEHNYRQLKPWEATGSWVNLYSVALHSSLAEAVRKAKEKTEDERMWYELEDLVRDVAGHLSIAMSKGIILDGGIREVVER